MKTFSIQMHGTMRIVVQIQSHLVIVHGILVPITQAPFHLPGNQQRQFFPFRALRHLGQFTYQRFQQSPVMTITDLFHRISHRRRLAVPSYFSGRHFVRIINIQLIIGHDSQMIPQFMLEIRYVTQMRKHVSHYRDYRAGTTLTLLTVFQRERIIHHFLDAASVLRHR